MSTSDTIFDIICLPTKKKYKMESEQRKCILHIVFKIQSLVSVASSCITLHFMQIWLNKFLQISSFVKSSKINFIRKFMCYTWCMHYWLVSDKFAEIWHIIYMFYSTFPTFYLFLHQFCPPKSTVKMGTYRHCDLWGKVKQLFWRVLYAKDHWWPIGPITLRPIITTCPCLI